MSLLQAQGIVRSFGGVQAVAGVDVSIAEGEFLSIIGPNGAGKTTLFNLLSGHDVPDQGSIAFAGAMITGWAPERIAALGMARTFQHGRVFGNLSVRDNILVGAHHRLRAAKPRLAGLGAVAELLAALIRPPSVVAEERALNAEVDAIAALFGDRLTPRLEHPAYSLSYANRRRVEIARALALHPRLLLLDEPTAGMNESETAEMITIIGRLKAEGRTLLLIEHKLDLVMRLSDRVIAMDDGRIIAEGPPDAVRRDPAVIEAYLGHRDMGHRDMGHATSEAAA
jgi:branched-chain amino acid transport system ATP-binding protein